MENRLGYRWTQLLQTYIEQEGGYRYRYPTYVEVLLLAILLYRSMLLFIRIHLVTRWHACNIWQANSKANKYISLHNIQYYPYVLNNITITFVEMQSRVSRELCTIEYFAIKHRFIICKSFSFLLLSTLDANCKYWVWYRTEWWIENCLFFAKNNMEFNFF